MRNQKKWTEEEIAILHEMGGKVKSAVIGKRLGRSKESVVKKMVALKIPPIKNGFALHWTPYQLEQFDLRHSEMTAYEFAKEYGLTKDQVYCRARLLKVKFQSPQFWTPERLELMRSGKSGKELAALWGKDCDQIMRRAKKEGIVLPNSRQPKINQDKPKHDMAARKIEKKKTEAAVQKKVPASQAGCRKRVVVYQPQLEMCPVHHCLVSNRQQHFERLGCRMVAA